MFKVPAGQELPDAEQYEEIGSEAEALERTRQTVTTLKKHKQKKKLLHLQAVLVVHAVLQLKRKLNLLQLVVFVVELLQHKTLHLQKLLRVVHVYFARANA